MPDVNEEILEQYLKVKKRWFYVGDIPFKVKHNYSNIDVLGYDPETDLYYDFEVKYRSAFSLPNNRKSIDYLVDQFNKYPHEREAKLLEFTHGKPTTKIVVTTYKMLGMTKSKRTAMEEAFHTKMKALGFKSEIWYFDRMIPELVRCIEETGRYNTQLFQTIRMLKVYCQLPPTST